MSTGEERYGWRSIEGVLETLYPGIKPQHFGTLMRWSEGGRDPLDGISVYPNDADQPHWHYISFGLSELYAKESENIEISGWGIELTFRSRRGKEQEAPRWPLYLMQETARYVIENSSPFGEYHYLDRSGPLLRDLPTTMRGVIFLRDPALGKFETPNGSVLFLQMFGATKDELKAFMSDEYVVAFQTIKAKNEWFVTELVREGYID